MNNKMNKYISYVIIKYIMVFKTKENIKFEKQCIIKYQKLLDKVQLSLIKRIFSAHPELKVKYGSITKLCRKVNFKKELNEYPFVTEYKKIEIEQAEYYYNNVGCLVDGNKSFSGFALFTPENNQIVSEFILFNFSLLNLNLEIFDKISKDW